MGYLITDDPTNSIELLLQTETADKHIKIECKDGTGKIILEPGTGGVEVNGNLSVTGTFSGSHDISDHGGLDTHLNTYLKINTGGTFDYLASSEVLSDIGAEPQITTLSVSKGGTGKSSVTANSYLKGNGTDALVERTCAEVLSDIGAVATATFNDHSARHEDGGADEISVAGLSGLLTTAQTSTNHNLIDTTHHPVSGLTTGHFLKATGATSYGFAAHGLSYSDVGAAPTSHAVNASTYGYGDATNAGHLRTGTGITVTTGTISVAYGTGAATACVGNDSRLSNARTPVAHQLDTSTYHTVSGLTTGHFLKALSATTFGFAAHGLTCTDVGAPPTAHAVNASTYGYGDATNAGHLRTGTGITVTTGTISVAYGTGASTACVGNDSRLSDARTPVAHNLINSTGHPVSGLTTGHFLKATGATTYGFAAHGLSYSDVGAAASSHTHSASDITSGGWSGYFTATRSGVPITLHVNHGVITSES